MQWIDMHCDTLSEIRKENVQSLRHNSLCVDLDRLKRAGAQAQFFACFVNAADYISPDEGRGTEKKPGEIYGSEVWDRAYAEVIEMADSALREEDGDFHIIRGAEDLTPEKTGEFIGGILTVEEGGVLNGKTERLEELCWLNGNQRQTAPSQRMDDFIHKRLSADLPVTSYTPGVLSSPLHFWMPEFITHRLREGFRHFGKVSRGFLTNEALMIGVETRTSSPVRILRDKELLQHVTLRGLFPCGEGAGYAGGIVSAAIDGERCAEMVAELLK